MFTLGAAVTLEFPTSGTSVALEVILPDGTTAAPTVPAPEFDKATVVYTPPRAGRYTYVFTDDAGGALSGVFNVRPGHSLALCSLSGAKRHLNMDNGSTVDDDELRGHIEAATGVIERHRNEVVALRRFTERVRPSVRGRDWRDMDVSVRPTLMLSHRPVRALVSATAVADASVVDVSGWSVDESTGVVETPGFVEADLTYLAGYDIVPDEFILAAEIIAAHLWETQRMSSMSGAAVDGQYLTPSGLGYAIPNRAVQLLGGRPPVIA